MRLLASCVLSRAAKHLVDIDEEALSAARAQLGTDTIKDTVNESLRRVGAARSKDVATRAPIRLATPSSIVARTHGAEPCRRDEEPAPRKVPDLLIAAAAEANGLTVLHYDADFDRISAVTGQRSEWVVPAGSVD